MSRRSEGLGRAVRPEDVRPVLPHSPRARVEMAVEDIAASL